MKNLIFLFTITLFLGFNFNLKAQEIKDIQERIIERFNEELDLSQNQLQRAREIHLKYKPEIDRIISETKPYRDKINALRERKIDEFESILTNEQKTKLIELKQNRKEKTLKPR